MIWLFLVGLKQDERVCGCSSCLPPVVIHRTCVDPIAVVDLHTQHVPRKVEIFAGSTSKRLHYNGLFSTQRPDTLIRSISSRKSRLLCCEPTPARPNITAVSATGFLIFARSRASYYTRQLNMLFFEFFHYFSQHMSCETPHSAL